MNDLPSGKTVQREEKMPQQTNRRSAVMGSKLATQKRKRGEEDVLSIPGNITDLITEWISIENEDSDDEPEVMVIATRIPKKGDTSAKHGKIGTSGVQQDTASTHAPSQHRPGE